MFYISTTINPSSQGQSRRLYPHTSFQRHTGNLPHQPITPRCRQQSHTVDFPDTQSKQQPIRKHINDLGKKQLVCIPIRLVPLKRLVDTEDSRDGSLEQHEDHHDAEDL